MLPQSSSKAVVARKLTKSYVTYLRRGLFGRDKKVVKALEGVSFDVNSGEVFGLLGPNGAGKTTTVKILSTLLLPDSGEAYVLGYDVVNEAVKVRRVIGVSLSVERGFFWKLTGRENLLYFGMLYGMDGNRLKRRVDEVLKLVGLTTMGAEDKLYEEYSLGMKARLSVARALLIDPEVMILDEPTLGLDPPSARTLRELLVKIAHEEGKTVLVTTHNMFEAEILCDRVAIINKGRIVAIDRVKALKQKIADRVSLEILTMLPADISVSSLISSIRKETGMPSEVFAENGGFRIKIVISPKESGEITSLVLKLLHNHKCSVKRVEIKEPTLEDVFIQLTGKTGF